jgi:hypothetical protein
MIKDYLIMILVIIIVLWVGIDVSVNYYQKIEKNCNDKFGKDNWKFIETTGTGKCRFYIGQCWECVKND